MAPVGGGAGGPAEGGVGGRVFEHPGEVVGVVGGEAELGAGRHDSGELVEGRPGDEAALAVAGLRPRVGKEDEGAGDRVLRQRGEEEAGVFGEDADVGEVALSDRRGQAGDAVLEDLAADKSDLGMRLGLGGEVLAAAEANLQPNRLDRVREKRRQVDRKGEGERRQQRLGKMLLPRAQLAAAAASVEAQRSRVRRRGATRRRDRSFPR